MSARSLTHVLVLLVSCLGGCSKDSGDPGIVVSKRIGPTGGSIEIGDDVELSVSAGALSSETEIRVSETADPPPADHTAYSKVYRFEPEGLVFNQPVEVRFSFDGDKAKATVYWTRLGSTDDFEDAGGTIDGSEIVVAVTHFSRGFVGAKPATHADGGLPDAREVDSRSPDSEAPDARPVDAPRDTSASDATTPDGPVPDASAPDTLAPDAAPLDAVAYPDNWFLLTEAGAIVTDDAGNKVCLPGLVRCLCDSGHCPYCGHPGCGW